MAISKGTDIFSIIDDGAICYEDSSFPNELKELQTYYGNTSGAALPPTTKKYLSGIRIGVATDLPQQTIGNKVYQHLTAKTEKRDTGGLFGWGSGKYSERDAGVWICIDDITIDRAEAEKALDERVNAAKIAKQKQLNDILKDTPNPDTLGNGDGSGSGSSLGIIGIILAIIAALFFWNKKKRKARRELINQQRAYAMQQAPMRNYKTTKL